MDPQRSRTMAIATQTHDPLQSLEEDKVNPRSTYLSNLLDVSKLNESRISICLQPVARFLSLSNHVCIIQHSWVSFGSEIFLAIQEPVSTEGL